jgi:hypothetical protein
MEALLALLAAGETDLVLGGLTAMESVVVLAVLTLVVDPGPVRRANAARRGRGAEVVLGWRTGAVPPLAAAALLDNRAASWLSDGRRAPPVFLMVDDVDNVVVGAAGAGTGVSVEFELIVVGKRGASESPNKAIASSSPLIILRLHHHLINSMRYFYCCSD